LGGAVEATRPGRHKLKNGIQVSKLHFNSPGEQRNCFSPGRWAPRPDVADCLRGGTGLPNIRNIYISAA